MPAPVKLRAGPPTLVRRSKPLEGQGSLFDEV